MNYVLKLHPNWYDNIINAHKGRGKAGKLSYDDRNKVYQSAEDYNIAQLKSTLKSRCKELTLSDKN